MWSGANLADLADTFSRYADSQWPGARTATFWSDEGRRGVTGVFEEAMPDAVIREWLVTDGRRLANASTFATKQKWPELLEDCENLVRSIRFESSAPQTAPAAG
jgi:hypothetical protein